MKLPSLPPHMNQSQVIVLMASGLLVFAAALLRIGLTDMFSITALLISFALLLFDVAVAMIVHSRGHVLAMVRAQMRQHDVEAHALGTAREQLAELQTAHDALAAERANLESTRSRKLVLDYDITDMKDWAAKVVTAEYLTSVKAQRGGMYRIDN